MRDVAELLCIDREKKINISQRTYVTDAVALSFTRNHKCSTEACAKTLKSVASDDDEKVSKQ